MGAVLTDLNYRIIGTGYNGAAMGRPHCADVPWACPCVHAEQNTLLYGSGKRLFVTIAPCFECAKLIAAAGVEQVIAPGAYISDPQGVRLLHEYRIMEQYVPQLFPGWELLKMN